MALKPTPQATIEGFLLRTRRVLSHSLIREQAKLMAKLNDGHFDLTITVNKKTGEQTFRLQAEYPPEEALESLASRVRPLILNSEPIYYEKVFNALEELVGTDKLNEEIDVAWWHNYWRAVIDANLDAQAYMVATKSGSVTDRKLMCAWLYGDVVHAKSPNSPVIRDLSVNQRYYAAAPGIARICDRVIYTHLMIKVLIDKGLLTADPEVLTQDVVVTKTVIDEPVQAYTAEVGTPLPVELENLDPKVWKSPHDVLTKQLRDVESPGDDGTE